MSWQEEGPWDFTTRSPQPRRGGVIGDAWEGRQQVAVSNTSVSPLILTAQDDADTRVFNITWIRWNGAAAAGDLLQVTDTIGNVIFESEADGANFIDIQPIFRIFRGVKIPNLDSGKVYIFYR